MKFYFYILIEQYDMSIKSYNGDKFLLRKHIPNQFRLKI